MKSTEIAELVEKLARKGYSDRALAVKNLLKCDREFIDEMNRILK